MEYGAPCSNTDELTSTSADSSTTPSDSVQSEIQARLSKSKQQQFTVGRASGRRLKPKPKDETLNYRFYGSMPLFARSCLESPTAPSGDDGEDTNGIVQPTTESDCQDLDSTEADQVHEQLISDQPSFIDRKTAHKCTRLPSPNIFPRVWLRREVSSRRTSVHNSSVPIVVPPEPSWVKDDGKIKLIFPRCLSAAIYEAELGVKLNLSKPDRSGWQNFRIAGLPSNEGKDTTGGFDFVIKPKIDTSMLPEIQYGTTRLLDTRTLGSRELVARFRLHEPLVMRIRPKKVIHHIENWNAAVTLYTFPSWSTNEGTQMEHHASLTLDLPDTDFFAEKVKFSMIVKYGPRKGSSHCLEQQDGSNCPPNDMIRLNSSHGPHNCEAEITVTRSIERLKDPVQLFFTLSYPCRDYVTTCLPKFRPKLGKVLLESIMLLKDSPPLFLEHLGKGHFSTWRTTESCDGDKTYMCLNRLEVSPLFPEGLKDDAMVRIRKLSPVHYEALEALDDPLLQVHPSDVVKELDIRIEEIFGSELECRMSLEVQVGSSSRLLTIDDSDWNPSFFLIDGKLATEKAGEWRENEEGHKTLFKSSTMDSGPTIKLEMRWKEMVTSDEFKGEVEAKTKVEYKIPRILDKFILGGTLQCRVDEGTYSPRKRKFCIQILY